MPSRARAVSPAASENEVDISGSLFTDDAGFGNAKNGAAFDVNDIFGEAAQDGEGDDDDEAFIALKQAASFRKSSNLKGKTVKKGGGFQAMGMSFLPPCLLLFAGLMLMLLPARSQCQPPARYYPEGLLRSHADSAKGDPPDPRAEGCRGHGANRFGKNGRLRDPHDRTPESPLGLDRS